ncbi:MAG: aldo/keto reductase [Spirochaetales bacterium]|nr:aldo/keto reductase [Spirochaetales bacterium]
MGDVPEIPLGERLTTKRIATGLWQVAGGHGSIESESAVAAMASLYEAGLTSFDMADHYGPAEEIAGAFREMVRSRGGAPGQFFTKWVPEPGSIDDQGVRKAVERSCTRLRTDRIDLLQFHWWDYLEPGYIPAMESLTALREEGLVGELGLTNFDTAHARILLALGLPIVSNQVHFSLLDDRAAGDMSALCAATGMKLLCYGTVAGGFLSDRWLHKAEPAAADLAGNWSLMKYHRFIRVFGGWELFQELLRVLADIARKHGVSISNVATKWVLDHPAVAAILIGARLGKSEHIADNLRLFAFSLDDEDRAAIRAVRSRAEPIPGDCGDEYRKAPFLTAAGDLSDHKTRQWRMPLVERQAASEGLRVTYGSGTTWEEIASYSRAVRRGRRIEVSGTTATLFNRVVPPGDAASQAEVCIDKIEAALEALGGRLEDVVRTRIYVPAVADDWEAVARVHGRRFAGIDPANTLVGARLVGDAYRVEIEAEAIVPDSRGSEERP